MIAALFVEREGAYSGIPDVDPWDEDRDAKLYAGPWPVIAHPPCQRWGRYWHGSPRKPHQFSMGDDKACFASAITSVRKWGGLLEHPADSFAWKGFGLEGPPRKGGWVRADNMGGKTCYVEQGHYGHFARKGTWLYAIDVETPELTWGRAPILLPAWMIERYGYEKARRIGTMAMVGGKDKTLIRDRTPEGFRDLLLSIVRPYAEATQ